MQHRLSMCRSLAQCNTHIPHNLGQRRSGSTVVKAIAVPDYLTSDDDEETDISTRVKLLQDTGGPNKTLLDAQARVCTGPTQTRPLDEEQAFKVLETILQSGTVIPCIRQVGPFFHHKITQWEVYNNLSLWRSDCINTMYEIEV